MSDENTNEESVNAQAAAGESEWKEQPAKKKKARFVALALALGAAAFGAMRQNKKKADDPWATPTDTPK